MTSHSSVHPLHAPEDRVHIATLGAWDVRQFAETDARLAYFGVAAPSCTEIRALERWFVLPMDATGGRLLRSWWAGKVAH